MMTAQGLQIASAKDAFAGLGIVADGVVGVDVVFRVLRSPVAEACQCAFRGLTDLIFLHGSSR